MPKANMTHLHFPASISQEFFFNLIEKDQRIFVDKNFKLKAFVTKNDEFEGY